MCCDSWGHPLLESMPPCGWALSTLGAGGRGQMEAPGEAATGGGARGRLGFQPCRAGGTGDRGPLRRSRELPGTCIIVRLWAGSKKALRVQRRTVKEAGAREGAGSTRREEDSREERGGAPRILGAGGGAGAGANPELRRRGGRGDRSDGVKAEWKCPCQTTISWECISTCFPICVTQMHPFPAL